jgi:hypothetical protein
MLADAYLSARNAERGLVSLDEQLTSAKSEERNWSAELSRLEGELLLLKGEAHEDDDTAKADILFRQAIDIARSQNAKSLELRATISLAQLLAKQSRRAEARTMLLEIYNWFTEGFDTADLKEARSLLDDLTA